jgi:hypothetical protein
MPGVSAAEGEEKGKGVIVRRGPEEASRNKFGIFDNPNMRGDKSR